ncbi:MAG: GIY-YIG nuclease family protein [Clostridia bacterium]|nr:GIY-YIG nuclease family protein [Clostridia bacterium]
MEEKKGYIYILTNPSFPEYVKIGYADDVDNRVQQLNSSECTPYAFRVYATYEVDSRLMDKNVHAIIDKLNPTLRSVEEYNGKIRKREFFAMSAEDAYSVFEAMAEIHNCMDKLQKRELNSEEVREQETAELISGKRHENYTFDYWQIPVGAELVYIEDASIKCTVVDPRKLEYNGEILYMTPFAKKISGKYHAGPSFVENNFMYNGETLKEIERRLHSKENN